MFCCLLVLPALIHTMLPFTLLLIKSHIHFVKMTQRLMESQNHQSETPDL